ncbi:MAG TPA: hypothetical protein VLB69_01285 [Rudaea sp.]|nr:hypothetical protein [Rudaea sp.]
MTAFWKNLQQLAHGQLFNGGHLGGEVARQLAKPETKLDTRRTRSNDAIRRPAHAQIATYR